LLDASDGQKGANKNKGKKEKTLNIFSIKRLAATEKNLNIAQKNDE